jgi:hypothetical protein
VGCVRRPRYGVQIAANTQYGRGRLAGNVIRHRNKPHRDPSTGKCDMSEYKLDIDDRAVLVVVRQYDEAGEEIAVSNIVPPRSKPTRRAADRAKRGPKPKAVSKKPPRR